MSNGSKTGQLDLPAVAEPARDFIESIVIKFTKEIDELKAEVANLKNQLAAKKSNRPRVTVQE